MDPVIYSRFIPIWNVYTCLKWSEEMFGHIFDKPINKTHKEVEYQVYDEISPFPDGKTPNPRIPTYRPTQKSENLLILALLCAFLMVLIVAIPAVLLLSQEIYQKYEIRKIEYAQKIQQLKSHTTVTCGTRN